jgi:hydroxymethylglutaryl-CoA lyase
MMKIIECPRDAMQGITAFIPTEQKVRYINSLLRIGFDTIDFGSFVSAKAIPQMKDTRAVLEALDRRDSRSKLLAIVANQRGAHEAASFGEVKYLGFPLSISETFQVRNTNKSIAEALNELSSIKDICVGRNKKLVTYISMGFGNPYGDPYDPAMVSGFIDILITLGSDVISIADTVGAAEPDQVGSLFALLLKQYPSVEIGVHLHSTAEKAGEKIMAAYDAGCRRFDGALKGFGGCPMANDELVGNIATESIISLLEQRGENLHLDQGALQQALLLAGEIFPNH